MRDGLLDWDCAEAIAIPDMIRALEHIRVNGTFPVSTLAPNLIRPRYHRNPTLLHIPPSR